MHTYAYYLSSRKRFADWATANSASLLPSFNKEEAQIAFCHICLAMFYPILFGASFGRGDKVDTISTVQNGLHTTQYAVYVGIVGVCSNFVALLEGIVYDCTVFGKDETLSIR
jgi:hypothetical protein